MNNLDDRPSNEGTALEAAGSIRAMAAALRNLGAGTVDVPTICEFLDAMVALLQKLGRPPEATGGEVCGFCSRRVRMACQSAAVASVCVKPALPDEPSGWQPIETAPRDGSRILLCANLQVKDRIGAGRYSVEPYISDGRGIIGAAEGFQGDGDQCIPSNQDVFTHWMPLPSAPVTKADRL